MNKQFLIIGRIRKSYKAIVTEVYTSGLQRFEDINVDGK